MTEAGGGASEGTPLKAMRKTGRAKLLKVFSATGAILLGATTAFASCPKDADPGAWIDGDGTCLVMSVAGAESAGPSPKLVVLLHGDAYSGGPADYLFSFAKSLARPGVVAVALLRPGYSDVKGRTSQGSNHNRRDSYTARNVTVVGKAIARLKERYKAGRVVVMGHSGGAAITGVLIGREPGLIDAAALVSCPCNIPRWVAERSMRPWPNSLSPHTFVARVPKTTIVVAITGGNDDNTRPGQVGAYVDTLTARGIKASAQRVEGAGHFFPGLRAAAAAAIQRALQ